MCYVENKERCLLVTGPMGFTDRRLVLFLVTRVTVSVAWGGYFFVFIIAIIKVTTIDKIISIRESISKSLGGV